MYHECIYTRATMGELPERVERGKMGERLTQEQRKELHEASETIIRSFNWETSRMGYDFWLKVFRELDRIAETGEP